MELGQKWKAPNSAVDTEHNDIFTIKYNRINTTKSRASGAGNVSESRLMSHIGRVCEGMYAEINAFPQSERWGCQWSSAYVVMQSCD